MQCRILLTTKCNLSCDYCCMKQDNIKNSFKRENLDNILVPDYDSFVISGGEPMLKLDKLYYVAKRIKAQYPHSSTFLHTNGLLLTVSNVMKMIGIIDGINLSIHDNQNIDYMKLSTINNLVPIRIHIWEKLVTDEIREFVKNGKIILKAWKMDECETVPEDRFILKD